MLPTITHIHMSVIPVLAGEGTIFLERTAHKTIYDGCVYARGLGATIVPVRRRRPRRTSPSCCGRRRPAPAAGLHGRRQQHDRQRPGRRRRSRSICREHDALLYVDDAHGFGVIGERDGTETTPYGRRGNSIVAHVGETYDDIVLVGGFSKAYSSLLAFLALPTWLKNHLKVAAPPYLYSGPSPTASLASVLAGFDVNARRGDAAAGHAVPHSTRVLDSVRELGVAHANAPAPRSSSCRWPSPRRVRPGHRVSCGAAASTSPWPPTRWCRATRSASGSRSPRPTPTGQIDHLINVIHLLADDKLLRRADQTL